MIITSGMQMSLSLTKIEKVSDTVTTLRTNSCSKKTSIMF